MADRCSLALPLQGRMYAWCLRLLLPLAALSATCLAATPDKENNAVDASLAWASRFAGHEEQDQFDVTGSGFRLLQTGEDEGNEKKKEGDWWPLVIVVLVAALLGGLAVFLWRRFVTKTASASSSAEGIQLQSTSTLEATKEQTIREAFDRADVDHDGQLSRDEVRQVIVGLPQLWAMLEVNTAIEAERCQDIATAVAMCKLDANKSGTLSWEEFRTLWTTILKDPKSQLDFFHQAMFNAFDADGNQTLDREELGHFLEIFYQKGGIFTGDSRLPEKDELVHRALEALDRNADRRLSFRELSPLMKGKMQLQ